MSKRFWCHKLLQISAMLILLAIAALSTAQAQTKIIRNGECEVTIIVPIEIFGPRATPELADRWKQFIEAHWNGPTSEMAHRIAEDYPPDYGMNVNSPNDSTWNFVNIDYQNFMRLIGADPNCALVNCCKICVKIDIKIRKPADSPTAGYHQVQVHQRHEGHWSTLGQIPGGAYIGEFETEWFRSSVQWGSGGPSSPMTEATTGSNWSDDLDWSSWAHEVGHLMGIDDHYEDIKDENGKTTGSKTKPGYPSDDLMVHPYGWPTNADFAEILKYAGLAINCCHDAVNITETVTTEINLSRTVLTSCNRDLIQDMILKLQARRESIASDKIPLTVKYDYQNSITLIDQQIHQLEEALTDCPPPTETISVFTGTDGGVWCSYGDGIWIPTVFTPIFTPYIPIVPPVVSTPQTPGTPGGPPPVTPPVKPPTTPTAEQPPPTTPTDHPPPTATTDNTPPTTTPDQPPSTTDNPPPRIPDTIFVKTSESVLEGGQTGTPLGDQVVKLFPAATPELPGTGPKTDTGFNKDPVQTRVGHDGTGTMKVEPNERSVYDLPQNGGQQNYRMDVELPRHDGVVAEITGKTPSAPTTPSGAKVTDTEFKVGDRTFMRLDIDIPYGKNLNFINFYTPILPGVGIDYCRTTKPGVPLGSQPDSLSALNHEVRQATLKLDRRVHAGRTVR